MKNALPPHVIARGRVFFLICGYAKRCEKISSYALRRAAAKDVFADFAVACPFSLLTLTPLPLLVFLDGPAGDPTAVIGGDSQECVV